MLLHTADSPLPYCNAKPFFLLLAVVSLAIVKSAPTLAVAPATLLV